MSQVDAIGNELGGIRTLEVSAPVGTVTPWALRVGYRSARDEMLDFLGTFVPLSRTDAEAADRGDGRPSLAALYPDGAVYRARVEEEIDRLVADGFLLEVDRARAREQAIARYRFVRDPER